jgi:hypothetical protein
LARIVDPVGVIVTEALRSRPSGEATEPIATYGIDVLAAPIGQAAGFGLSTVLPWNRRTTEVVAAKRVEILTTVIGEAASHRLGTILADVDRARAEVRMDGFAATVRLAARQLTRCEDRRLRGRPGPGVFEQEPVVAVYVIIAVHIPG